jgi:hypothetical protein
VCDEQHWCRSVLPPLLQDHVRALTQCCRRGEGYIVSYREGSDTQSIMGCDGILSHFFMQRVCLFITISYFFLFHLSLIYLSLSFLSFFSLFHSIIINQYSPFFSLSSLSLLLSLQCPAGFDSVVPSLLQRAEAIVGRQFANDSEFLYAVLKLLHRIGTRSVEGHRCVRGCVM